MTDQELIAAEAPNLPSDPSECWSREGALWNQLGPASGLAIADILRAERNARESFASREEAIAQVRGVLK